MGAVRAGGAAVIIQARMGSSRLPGKSMRILGDRPVLDWVVQRVAQAAHVDQVIVATSTESEDDVIAEHLSASSVTVVRGSALNVLSRFGDALAQTDATVIGRITADCPFVQPQLLEAAVVALEGSDYVSTGLDGRFPRGFDLEVMRRSALETALAEATADDEREHVTPFIYRHPERFALAALTAPTWAQRPDLRLTLDEADDWQVIRAVVAGLAARPETLTGQEIIDFLDAHPEVARLNRHVEHRVVS